jgi:hypothetical protein
MTAPELSLSKGQLWAVVKLCKEATGFDGHNERVALLSGLAGRQVSSSKEITLAEWRRIRDAAYPNWPENDWTMAAAFKAKAQGILRQFLEDLGQLQLPM